MNIESLFLLTTVLTFINCTSQIKNPQNLGYKATKKCVERTIENENPNKDVLSPEDSKKLQDIIDSLNSNNTDKDPNKPSNLDDPDKPGKNDNPNNPGKKDNPNNPGKKDNPNKPGKNDNPNKPDEPQNTKNPNTNNNNENKEPGNKNKTPENLQNKKLSLDPDVIEKIVKKITTIKRTLVRVITLIKKTGIKIPLHKLENLMNGLTKLENIIHSPTASEKGRNQVDELKYDFYNLDQQTPSGNSFPGKKQLFETIYEQLRKIYHDLQEKKKESSW